MPTTEIELDYGYKALDWVVYRRDVKEHFRVAHEAGVNQQHWTCVWFKTILEKSQAAHDGRTHLVILSSILRGSRMKVGRTTRLKSAPGRSCDMICESTAGGEHGYIAQRAT